MSKASVERQRHMMDVLAQARAEHDRRWDRAQLVATIALIAALAVIGAVLAGGQ